MTLGRTIIKPSFSRPAIYHGSCPVERESKFGCIPCGAEVAFCLALFLEQGWGLGSDLLKELEVELTEVFDIPIVGKSHDGGFPSYRLVSCSGCDSEYIVYAGVNETSNSIWRVTVQGVIEYDVR